MVFSTRIFRNLDFGIEWVLRFKAMELESLRYVVSRHGKVVLIKPTFVLFSLETVSQGTFAYIYNGCPIKKFNGEGRVIRDKFDWRFKICCCK